MLARGALLVSAFSLTAFACASGDSKSKETRYTIIKNDQGPPPTGGVPPDKEAEVRLVLQQREVSTRKCYQDILNEKGDRSLQGTVKVIIALGTAGSATDVRVQGGTLNNQEVTACLVETIKGFEFPALEQAGEVQYEYMFRPAY